MRWTSIAPLIVIFNVENHVEIPVEIKIIMLKFSALQWLRGTIEVHDEMDEMKQEQESMKLVPKVEIWKFLNIS